MGRRIVVTGATGTVGRRVSARLLAQGADVLALSSRPDAQVPGTPAARVQQADLRDPAALRRAFDGADAVFLLLPLVPDKPALARTALQAAQAAGVRHVLRLSAIGADAASDNVFARVQGGIDDAVAASGIAWTLLRPAGFMQNYATYGAAMIRAGRYFAAHADAAQAMVDADDIAGCAAAVLADPAAHAGAVYTPTGARAWTHAQTMALIGQAIGRPVAYVPIDDDAARAALQGMGMPEPLLSWMVALGPLVRSGLGHEPTGDVQRLTGRAPRSLEDFVRENAQVWR